MIAPLANPQRAVVITGASTGIGRAAAVHLAQRGMLVFAGVRREADGAALVDQGGGRIEPLPLDVTDIESIARARAQVDAALGATPLWGLVNNAGISAAGPLEVLPLPALHKQFDVNVFGLVAVTQAFLPSLRAAHGRLVMIGSIAGRSTTPFAGAYCASKHAVEAICDALRVELAPFGVQVALVEPGAVKTPLWERGTTAATALMEKLPAEALALYEAPMQRMRVLAERAAASGVDADRVASVIEHALTAQRARPRYLVGTDARVQLLLALLPEFVRDRLYGALLAPAKG